MRIYSVKANSEAGNIWVYVMTTQKDQNRKILSWGSQKLTYFARKFSRGFGYRRERCSVYLSGFEKTPKKLILESLFLLKTAATLLSGSRKGAVGAK